MHDDQTLREVGRSAVGAVRSRHSWIHRRVESLTFPSPATRVFRRQLSIDFTIPDIKPVTLTDDGVSGDRPTARYYVPLSVLRKWPPVLRLDLRTGGGASIPLLTRAQNGVLDQALLSALARDTLQVRDDEALPGQLDQDIRTLVESIDTRGNGRPASNALRKILPPVLFGSHDDPSGAWQHSLRDDALFVELAGGLRDNTLLWLRVEGRPGDREIVKFSYDIDMTDHLSKFSAAAYGLRPFEVEFKAPHLGNSGSYHLILSTPPPVIVADTEVVIKQPGTHHGAPDTTYVVAQCSAAQKEKAEHGLNLYAETFPHDARFYVTGERTGLVGSVWVALMIDKTGFVRSAAMATMAIAAVLGLYLNRLETVVVQPGSAVSLLLLVPGLLAYLLVRPSEHPLVGQFLSGLRYVLMLAGCLPLVGAAALVLHGNHPPGAGFYSLFFALFLLALVCVGVMVTSWVLPLGRSRQPLSAQAKRAMTAPRGQSYP